jgi:hypothetical protein
MLLEFTHMNGNKILINADHIVTLRENLAGDGMMIETTNDHGPYAIEVKTKYEDFKKRQQTRAAIGSIIEGMKR